MIRTEKTLVEVLETLRKRGYTEDFNLLKIRREANPAENDALLISDLCIDKTYRFSEQNDVGDEAILYAMHNHRDGTKGVFVNGYGVSADAESHDIIMEIEVNEEEEDDEDWVF